MIQAFELVLVSVPTMSDDMGDDEPVDYLTRNMSLHHSDDAEIGSEEATGQLQLELEGLNQALYHKFQARTRFIHRLRWSSWI